jgi:ABC-type polar amino acid transport system ATPase subunit
MSVCFWLFLARTLQSFDLPSSFALIMTLHHVWGMIGEHYRVATRSHKCLSYLMIYIHHFSILIHYTYIINPCIIDSLTVKKGLETIDQLCFLIKNFLTSKRVIKMSIVQVVNCSKSLSKTLILNNINLSVQQGEILGIIGKSGSGKSTLLKCLSMLEPFDSGCLTLSSNIYHFPESKSSNNTYVGIVFQDYCLWPHMTAIENITLAPLCNKIMQKKDASHRAHEILVKLGIADKAHQYPEKLSGGQKQKVAIARCLIMQPKILLMDEPTSALDPSSTKDLLKIISHLKKIGITVIISSHEMNFIEKIVDSIIFISDGEIKEIGTFNIIKKPKSKELKQFIESLS